MAAWLRRRWKPLAAAVAVIAVVSTCAGVWFGGLKHRYVPENWAEVTPGMIYRSARIHPALVEAALRSHGVKTVVDLSATAADNSPASLAEAAAAAKLGGDVHYCFMGGSGACEELESYPDAVEFLARSAKAGKPALVHCANGINRTGGVVAVYQALVERKDGKEIYAAMLARGFNPERNDELLPFLAKNMGYFAAELKKRGVIDQIPNPEPVIGPR